MSLADIRTNKLCFVYCGERCNCEIGMDWKFSEETKARLAEIDRNIAEAPRRIAEALAFPSQARSTTENMGE